MAVKTLSIPDEMNEFLNLHPDLSPSKLLQSKIIEIRERRRIVLPEIIKLQKTNEVLQRELQTANEKIFKLEENA